MSKLREMILYIVERVGVKSFNHLCCLLYLVDVEAYLTLGRPISEVTYIRGREVPEPKGIRELLLDMQAKNEIGFVENFLEIPENRVLTNA